MGRQLVEMAELVERWTIVGADEEELVKGKRGATKLGFALLLKFYTAYGRFPRGRTELPDEVVEHVASQVGVPASELGLYEWSGRTVEYHRRQIREHLGFRECSVADADKLADWLAGQVAHAERDADKVRAELLKEMRERRIEPPTDGRLGRIVASALSQAEKNWFAVIEDRLGAETASRVLALVGWGEKEPEDGEDVYEGPESVWSLIRSAPGKVSLESLRTETRKVLAARGVGLPERLFADVAPKVLAGWRGQCAVESPSHLRRRSRESAATLIAAFVHERTREITDDLTSLLMATVHRIDASAHRKVTQELVNAFKKVDGKEAILFRIADAALAAPGGTVSDVVYPAVSGGEQTLRELVHEYKTKGPVYKRTVRTTLKASYTNHYRAGMIELLDVLEFGSTIADHPLLAAIEYIRRHAKAKGVYFPAGDPAPRHKGTDGDWAELAFRTDAAGRVRAVRQAYEVATFRALRELLTCKEIWVVGAGRYRNPDDDLPKDFEARRGDYYAELRKSLDPQQFVSELRGEMETELAALNDALPNLSWVQIADRGRQGPIKLTPLDPQAEPRNLRRIKHEVSRRWSAIPLIDIAKEALLRSGALARIAEAVGANLPFEILAERLILAIYGYGTNAGIKAVIPAGGAHTEEEVRYVRRRYLTPEVTAEIATIIANATFAVRDEQLWGTASTTVASDSTHFKTWDQNLFTEWHVRYGGRGVLVYWHVEKNYVVVHAQVIKASSSEVAAMVQGAIHHGTTMKVEGNYTDTHGQSEIGFGITRLLNVDLLPRIKRINHVRLYRPEPAGTPDRYARLAPALHRAIDWKLIEDNYDLVMKYAAAISSGTATAESVLSRFRGAASHPAYRAMLEIGKAQRTIFICRYLRDRDLQRQVEEGLNVVEAWNRANSIIAYGKTGEISTNSRDEVEMTVSCLRILQAGLVYVNTLMLQHVLAEPEWEQLLGPADRRGLTALFWEHVRPYGEVNLDLGRRLSIGDPSGPAAFPQAD